MDKSIVQLYTDGACRGNPGPGGWACLIRVEGSPLVRELAGGEAQTTNNRMELLAVIKGLESLPESSVVQLFSDSIYVVNGLNEWLDGWIERNWRNASRKPVMNKDLWVRLAELRDRHELVAHWVKAHADHPENERCDQLATAQIDMILDETGE